MKTTSQTTQSFPETSRFIIYVFAVAVFCFFNWMALQAQPTARNHEIRLAAALFEEAEQEIAVAPWMLDFSYGLLTAGDDIEFEPWMLDFSVDLTAEREPEIELEPWMLTFSDDCLVEAEPGLVVEDWMTNRFLWDTACLIARK
jgi:hypothetical protein